MADAGRDDLRFACVPENLRLGRAFQTFRSPDRFVAGVRSDEDRARLAAVLERFGSPIEWMGVESAEMTKHALNAFLATSVAFINEVAAICEARRRRRIRRGPGPEERAADRAARLPLARRRLRRRDPGARHPLPQPAWRASRVSPPRWSTAWPPATPSIATGPGAPSPDCSARLRQRQAGLAGRRIAVWGLTYKPGTNTLRRSSALELCRWLAAERASVQAYDPAISALPAGEPAAIELAASPSPRFRAPTRWWSARPGRSSARCPPTQVVGSMTQPVVLDPGGHLRETLGHAAAVRYVRVGVPAA